MVGVRRLEQEECSILIAGRDRVDLRDQANVNHWFDEHRPEAVFLAAARVGGIHENDTHPGDFLYDNIAIACNVTHTARQSDLVQLRCPTDTQFSIEAPCCRAIQR